MEPCAFARAASSGGESKARSTPHHHAKPHKQWRDAHDDEFALDFLPPYSPDLNPAERVW
jgi:transposase